MFPKMPQALGVREEEQTVARTSGNTHGGRGTLKHGTIVEAAKDCDDDRTNGPGPAAPVLLWREVEIMGGGR